MSLVFTFCPRCGAPLADGIAFHRPHRLCGYCGFIQFRDPKVAVGALISDGTRILLVRRSGEPGLGRWALPAGYMDADEMPEAALVREVLEETGLKVRPRRHIAIVPLAGWREQRGILLLYEAEPEAGELTPGDDVSEARWFAWEEIPWPEIAFESTADFLRRWHANSELAS